jgi:glycosyltransferase involved in cell wall biosynthesis
MGDRLLWINTRLVHRLVTGPETMVEYYAQEYGVSRNKIRLLYNDVPLNSGVGSKGLIAKTRLGIAGHKSVVLFVGRVSPLKGGNNLIPLATRLKKLCPDACLLVVGSCDPLPHLPANAQRLQLGNLRFCGPVPNSETGGYYQAADVLILPSESEGFPRVLTEAMSHGVPVVAFDVGGVRDIVHPQQLPFVVPRGNLESMIEKVALLLDNEALRREQSQCGYEAVQRFSTTRVAQMFVDVVVRDTQ